MRTYLACFFLLATAAAGAARPIAETDLYAFRWLADPQIAPDGAQVVYTLVNVNAKHDGYDTALWTVSTSGGAPRQLTAGSHDSSARWSPDGKRLAFLRSIEKDGKPQPPQIYVLPMDGGEARAWTDLKKGAGVPIWSPDGRRIAFTSSALPTDSGKEEEKSDVRVINRAVYRDNNEGYYNFERQAHIWTVEDKQKPQPVTTGRFAEEDPVWSRDGSRIYFLSVRELEDYYAPTYADLYVTPSKGGDITKVAHMEGEAGGLALDPSGSRIALIAAISGTPIRSYSQPDLFVTALQPGSQPKNLTGGYDYDIGASIGGDQHPPRAGSQAKPLWSKDGRYVLVGATEEGRANLKRIDVETGKVEALTQGDRDIYAYSATPDASKLAVAISTPVSIGDLFVLDVVTGKMKQLTNINEELFSNLKITEPEMIWYKSFDGRRIQAWVQRPPDFTAGNIR